MLYNVIIYVKTYTAGSGIVTQLLPLFFIITGTNKHCESMTIVWMICSELVAVF